MVLAELGSKIAGALKKLNNHSTIDEKVLNEILTEIASALLSADVNIKQVVKLRDTVKTQVILQMDRDQNQNYMKKLIQKVVVEELTAMLSPEGTTEKDPRAQDNSALPFKKGKQNVCMFVGLQGSGKTTTCTKFAYYYMRKGWRVGLVCCDTFRAGAFD